MNAVPFRPKPRPEEYRRLDQISLILKWSVEMHEAGHMPRDVAKAFTEYFSGEPAED